MPDSNPGIGATPAPNASEPHQLTLTEPGQAIAPEPAKLRIYLGAAPGVGKTFQMLETAHLMHAQGIDVVIGLIETHGRADTAAMIKNLEVIPLKEVPYRSVTLHEMDLDAVLNRHPDTVIVDELAHTNIPGSRNYSIPEVMAVLWQAVQELSAEVKTLRRTRNGKHA